MRTAHPRWWHRGNILCGSKSANRAITRQTTNLQYFGGEQFGSQTQRIIARELQRLANAKKRRAAINGAEKLPLFRRHLHFTARWLQLVGKIQHQIRGHSNARSRYTLPALGDMVQRLFQHRLNRHLDYHPAWFRSHTLFKIKLAFAPTQQHHQQFNSIICYPKA